MQFLPIINGRNFRPAEARAVFDRLVIGQPVRLERETDPKVLQYDAYAIRVLAKDDNGEEHFIGFIARTETINMGPIMDSEPGAVAEGHECQVLDAHVHSVADPKKPVLLVELSTGWEVDTEVAQREAEASSDDEA